MEVVAGESASTGDTHHHPVLGRTLSREPQACHIYTRTVVLWALNVDINTEDLWQNVVVLGGDGREVMYDEPIPNKKETGHPRHGPRVDRERRLRSTSRGPTPHSSAVQSEPL